MNLDAECRLHEVTNIFVDQEGVSFIDSGMLTKETIITPEQKIQKLSITLAKRLMCGEASLEECYYEMKNFQKTI